MKNHYYVKTLAFLVSHLVWVGGAQAQEGEAPKEAADVTENVDLEKVVYGFYVDFRVGGGYALKGATLEASAEFPGIAGQDESLSLGSISQLSIGVDINEMISIKALGGMSLISGGRVDRVRDLAIAYGGFGLGVGLPMSERFRLKGDAAFIYASADNAVEAPEKGVGGLVGFGVEYFVHVRHFSVGVDLTALLPSKPFRAFVSLAPYLKYTF